MGLQLHPELHVSRLCELVDLVVSKPELSHGVTESMFVVIPVPLKVLPGFSIITTPLNNLSSEKCKEKNMTSNTKQTFHWPKANAKILCMCKLEWEMGYLV